MVHFGAITSCSVRCLLDEIWTSYKEIAGKRGDQFLSAAVPGRWWRRWGGNFLVYQINSLFRSPRKTRSYFKSQWFSQCCNRKCCGAWGAWCKRQGFDRQISASKWSYRCKVLILQAVKWATWLLQVSPWALFMSDVINMYLKGPDPSVTADSYRLWEVYT